MASLFIMPSFFMRVFQKKNGMTPTEWAMQGQPQDLGLG